MVSRPGMNAATEALLASKATLHPVIATMVDWPGDRSYSHTGRGNLRWGSLVFFGTGPASIIAAPAEQSGIIPAVGELHLVGVPDEMLDTVASQDARGSLVKIWVGFTTTQAGNVLMPGTSLVEFFVGYIIKQALRIEIIDEETLQQALILSIGTGPRGRVSASVTHSDEDQRRRYPQDTAGRHTIYSEKQAKREFWTP